jgi:UDP-2-acetamido-3-amino-2,3-dideoxy-glucuronate N-acetyltransferase
VVVPTRVCRGASIGSGATILCGITIGEKAMVGAGAVVTRDVAPGETVVGVPARVVLRSLGQERRA